MEPLRMEMLRAESKWVVRDEVSAWEDESGRVVLMDFGGMKKENLTMTDTPSFADFWVRWRGPKEGRLANQNEGKEEARIKWGQLTKAHKILAKQWGPHFQREFRKANGEDCSMLHCCRYLGKKRFLNYEDEEVEPKGVIVKNGTPEFDAWAAHYADDWQTMDYLQQRQFFAVPSKYPPQSNQEEG